MAESVGSISLDLAVNKSTFNSDLNQLGKMAEGVVGKAFKGLGLTIAGAFAVDKLIEFGTQSLELASNLFEVQNVVDKTFTTMSSQIDSFSKTALDKFGLSELSAKKFSSTFGAMMKSSGVNQGEMVKMSTSLTGLVGDFASFYNYQSADVYRDFQSMLAGQTETMMKYGINMQVANLEAYMLSQGITKSWQAMSQAEKTLLRYNYLLSASKDAQSDFSQTSGSWANQTRLLSEQWKIFMGTMGGGFINILTPIVRGLNLIISKLQIAAQYFKAFTDYVFGVSQATNQASKTTNQMSASTNGLGNAVKKTGKNLKGSTASFDQLTTLTKTASDNMDSMAGSASDMGGMGLGLAGGTPNLAIDPKIFEPVKAVLDGVKNTLGEVWGWIGKTFGPSAQQFVNGFIPVIQGWKNALFGTFTDLKGLGEPLKQWFVSDLVPFVQEYIVILGNVWSGILDSGLKVFNGLRSAIMPILQAIATDGLPVVTSMARGFMQVFQSIFDTTKTIFDTLWQGVITPTMQLISKIIVDVLGSIKKAWDDWGGQIVSGLVTAFKNLQDLFKSFWKNILEPIWSEMLKMLSWLWDKHLKGLVDELLKFTGKLITGALEIYNKFIVPLGKYLTENLGPIFASTFQLLTNIVGSLLGTISDVAKGVVKSLGGIVDFIVGVFTGNWSKAWGGVKNIFIGIFDSIVGILKGSLNIIIDLINSMIGEFNKIKIDVPSWVPGDVGGKQLGFSVSKIPKLANGGLISQPTLAMVGDNRNAQVDPEVVSPLSKLEGMIAKVINNSSSGGNRPIEVVVKLGEVEFIRALGNAHNNYARQFGGSPFEI
jgi:hypothetical protein